MSAESKSILSRYKVSIPIALLLVILFVVLVLLPDESILGPAVKYVYLHVALAFTGTLGFGLMALTGIVVLLFNKDALLNLVISLGLVSVGAYTLSILVSMISASISWGSVSLTEPYMVMSIQVLLASLVVQISYVLIPWIKLKAVMSLIPIVFLLWLTNTTKLVLHPASPIRDSSSTIIKISFAAVFIPCILISGLVVFQIFNYLKNKDAVSAVSDT